jgi:dCMP deaminase
MNGFLIVDKFDNFYMNLAIETSKLSYCERAKVGCIAVKEGNILGFGFNGTVSGHVNCCEKDGKTKDDVLHAEQNLITKCARNGVALRGATVFCTLTPCIMCAKLLIQSGISRLVIMDKYRHTDGYDLLTHKDNKRKIKVEYING